MKLMLCASSVSIPLFYSSKHFACVFFNVLQVEYPCIIIDTISLDIYAVPIIAYFSQTTDCPCIRQFVKFPVG